MSNTYVNLTWFNLDEWAPTSPSHSPPYSPTSPPYSPIPETDPPQAYAEWFTTNFQALLWERTAWRYVYDKEPA